MQPIRRWPETHFCHVRRDSIAARPHAPPPQETMHMLRSTVFSLALIATGLGINMGPAKADGWTVSLDGFGPVRLGMTIDDAQRALNLPLQIDDYLDDESCRYFTPKGSKGAPSIAFMTDHRRIVRIDVFPGAAPSPQTDRGAKIGDTEARIFELYRNHVKSGPHHYTGPQGHYLRVLDDSGHVRMIFETDGKTVENYRVGREPAVEYVEGCL